MSDYFDPNVAYTNTGDSSYNSTSQQTVSNLNAKLQELDRLWDELHSKLEDKKKITQEDNLLKQHSIYDDCF